MELRKSRSLNKRTHIISAVTATAVILVVIIRLNYPSPHYSQSPPYKHKASSSLSSSTNINININPPPQDIKIIDDQEKCDIFSGEWVPNPDAPYYTNTSCWAIHEHQNCMKYGRPDSDFFKWRWKPDACDLPLFNPFQFLDIVRDKSLAFVGDSVGRNQMQSMICLLSRVCYSLLYSAPIYFSYSIY